MEKLKNVIEVLRGYLDLILQLLKVELFTLGGSVLTLSSLLYLLISLFLLVYISGKLKKSITKLISTKYDIEIGTIQSIATIIRYLIMFLGSMVIIQSAGIDMSALCILAGALGVGIVFGLQNITNNFISGLVILFEQPIKVGDRVTVANIEGDVVKISARATTVNTNDNITLIIPNSEFISATVTNWSHNDRNVAIRIPVGVSYKEDPLKVKETILSVLKNLDGILSTPEPEVLFTEYGDNSINFTVRIWTTEYSNKPLRLRSMVYYALFEEFKNQGIEIPFPQRDLHLKSSDISFKL